MADEGGELEDFDVEKDLPTFLVSVLDSTDAIFEGTFTQGVPEAHAEVILGFHVTSQYFPNMDVRHICAPQSVKLYGNVSLL